MIGYVTLGANDMPRSAVFYDARLAEAGAKRLWEFDRVRRKAIELGARNEGAAGPRGEGFYAGYFCDLDGNKLKVSCAG
jgi:predicted lactoylglutathione lyase